MVWETNGAVERGAISAPHKDLAEGAGQTDPLAHNGYFERFPHLPAFLGFAILLAASLAMIATVCLLQPDFHCRPADTRTTNHTPTCKARR